MVDRYKQIKLLEGFMKTIDIEGICGFWIEDEGRFEVYIIIDLDWLRNTTTRDNISSIAKELRISVREEINKWLGFDVYVGSTTKKCDKINESIIETKMMNEIDLKDIIVETISEEMFIMRRKIELITKILINYDSIDCDNPSKESYQRIYCDNMIDWSYEKVENLKNNLQEKLYNLIKQEVRKSKFLKK